MTEDFCGFPIFPVVYHDGALNRPRLHRPNPLHPHHSWLSSPLIRRYINYAVEKVSLNNVKVYWSVYESIRKSYLLASQQSAGSEDSQKSFLLSAVNVSQVATKEIWKWRKWSYSPLLVGFQRVAVVGLASWSSLCCFILPEWYMNNVAGIVASSHFIQRRQVKAGYFLANSIFNSRAYRGKFSPKLHTSM